MGAVRTIEDHVRVVDSERKPRRSGQVGPTKQTVQDWMSSPVVVIPPEITVDHALTLMRRRGIHSLVVDLSTSDGRSYGIITTTDIRDKIAAQGRDPAQVRVAEIMTSPITCAAPDWTLREAAMTMQDLNIHHLPVQDRRATLIGVISATDIFTAVEEAGWNSTP